MRRSDPRIQDRLFELLYPTAYTYDNNNNRLTKVVTGGPTPSGTTYTYNNLNQLTQYTDGSRLVQVFIQQSSLMEMQGFLQYP
ncbi:hypothetical protein DB346_13845 [Verrucomicrobia bacterium LW23]|nr:hypothetical protein DB346_13845 [Verrucomicrobia bacterium LW23]